VSSVGTALAVSIAEYVSTSLGILPAVHRETALIDRLGLKDTAMQARREFFPAGRLLARTLRNASGITLIEVLICALVVGIGAVALALMFANGQTVIAGEGDNRVAVYLAQQKIELCRAAGFDNVVAGIAPCTSATNPELFSSTLGVVGSNPFYSRTTTIDCVDANDYSSTVDCTPVAPRRLTVTVQSNENTRTRNATLRAVLANPNP
jgi:Tfp pilus assembly protein PilV